MNAERAHIYKSAAAIPKKSLASLALFREPYRARRMGTFCATQTYMKTNRLKGNGAQCHQAKIADDLADKQAGLRSNSEPIARKANAFRRKIDRLSRRILLCNIALCKTRCSPLTRLANQRDIFLSFSFQS